MKRIKKTLAAVMILTMMFTVGCAPENNDADVRVTTYTPQDITATTAVCGGDVIVTQGLTLNELGVCWSESRNPTVENSHVSTTNWSEPYVCTITGLAPGTKYHVRAYALRGLEYYYGDDKSFTTEENGGGGGGDDHAYVDLGLPSGTLWATCNVGASSPEDYGDYFAWGETSSKSTYNWNTYQFCNGSNTTLTKYCDIAYYGNNGFTDNLTVLQPGDDAATINWWGDWRMPTKEEWEELYQNTTVTQTTQNGVNGLLFTASNGNTLFLPAHGYLSGSTLHYNGCGYYWSSSLYTGYPDASRIFRFMSGDYFIDNLGRQCGLFVRAVRSGQPGLNYYSVTVSSNSVSGGTVTGGGVYQQGQSCTVLATANTDYSFTCWAENGILVSTNASYTFTVTGDRSLVAYFTYSGDIYVDLGLPSGTLWATCNVGASGPEDYGDYFAWGETQPKDVYNWSTYQYCNGSLNTLTKYCNNHDCGYGGFTDNLTTLEPIDDAATANWGDGWRMPTEAEWEELLQNTTNTWITQNGVNGRLFTATNGNTLFLPAAGYRWGDGLSTVGSHGYYWSSSLHTYYSSSAMSFGFLSGNYYMYDSDRLNGRSVRPVRSSTQK